MINKTTVLIWLLALSAIAAELPNQWKAVPAKSLKVENDVATVLSSSRSHLALEQDIGKLIPGAHYTLSARIKSSVPRMAYLQVKTYRNGKELKRYNSPASATEWQTLKCEFQPSEADAVKVHIRIVADEANVKEQVFFGRVSLDEIKKQPHTTGRLTIVPTYENCGYYLNLTEQEKRDGIEVRFRPTGTDTWQSVEPVYMPDEHQSRGSITGLAENTRYELEIKTGKETLPREFTTLNSKVPVGKTITLDPATFNGLTIMESGTPEAWIKYTAAPGAKLTGNQTNQAIIRLENVRYIILENLTISGGDRYGIWLENCENIQIINCDISGFGRIGIQDFERDGKYFTNGIPINYDPGINIFQSGKILVERCFIHSPRGRANSWFYSHPAGPQAIFVLSTGGTVLRYNDFIGGDLHRWNDGVEGNLNGYEHGGFYRDADIYGNMFALGNDDGIELDGGQMNVRLYRNRFEHFLCGVSTAPCMLGPVYIFQNLITNLGDENDSTGSAFKNGHGTYGKGRMIITNNTISVLNAVGFGGYSRQDPPPIYVNEIKAIIEKNIFQTSHGSIAGLGSLTKRRTLFDFNQHECTTPYPEMPKLFQDKGQEKNGIFAKVDFRDPANGDFRLNSNAQKWGAFLNDEPLPYRPIPVTFDKQQIAFHEGGPAEIQLQATVGGNGFASAYQIRYPQEAEWISVSPSEGTLKSGDKITFTVKADPAKLPVFRRGNTVILLRLADGFSRPVSVSADWRGNSPNPQLDKSKIIELPITEFSKYDKFPKGTEGEIYLSSSVKEQLNCEFEVKEAGEYYLFAQVRCPAPPNSHNSFKLSVDGDEMLMAKFTFNASPNPVMVGVTRNLGSGRAKHAYERHKLSAGKHRISIEPRQGQYISKLVLCPNPDWLLK